MIIKNKPMVNPVKWYFLKISEMPIMWGGLVGLMSYLIYFFLAFPPYVINLDTWPLALSVLSVPAILMIAFIVLNLIVVKTKITVFNPGIPQVGIIYNQDNNPVLYEKPIWGKPDYKLVRLSQELSFDILLARRHHLQLKLEVEVDNKKIIYPFLLNFVLKEMPTALDFHYIILFQEPEIQKQKVFIFNDCLQSVFTKFNLEKNRSELERISRQLLNDRDDRNINLDMINMLVSFPSQLLPTTVFSSLVRDDIRMRIFNREYSI